MKTSKWTDEQLAAINVRNRGIIVSAAAGSGKTSVLVERLVRILSDTENKIPADRLAVVTFTNDAAAQMKQRLAAALTEKIASEPENLWLCNQQILLQTAKISTIHSFCFDLIRENIQALDVSAGFRILDGAEEALLMRKAAENVFEKFYKEQPEKTESLADFFSGSQRGDAELEEALLKLYIFLMSIPFYEDWLTDLINFYGSDFVPEADPLVNEYLKRLENTYKKIIGKAEYAQSLFENSFGKTSAALGDDIRKLKTALAALKNSCGTWDSRTAEQSFKFARFDTLKGLEDSEKDIKDGIMKIRDKYKKELDKLWKGIFTEEDIRADYKKHAEVLNGIFEMEQAFAEELKTLKTAKNALGLSDAEPLAIKLLAEKDENGRIVKTALAKELSEYYSVIMIDEFQDANNNQDLIFKMLSKGGTAEKWGSNLFAVGDVKQSIYRFRLANPKLFLDALSKSEEYSEDMPEGENAAISLNKNFRSSGEVIGFVNYVFGMLMTEETGEIEYTEKEALIQGAEYPEGGRTTEMIIVHAENIPAENEDEESGDGEAASAARYEAKAVSDRIRSMLGAAEVYENGTVRLCEPRDFCILMRNKKNADLFVKALDEAGIRACAEEAEGYLRSREISALTSLLSVIDNPMQDIPLAAALMSPMFMLNAEDMAMLAEIKKERDIKYFAAVKAVVSGDTGITEEHPVYAKLKRFTETFEKLRLCAASQKLERFIRTIYDSTDFLSAVQVYKDGSQKRANLRLLLDIADSWEKNSDGGLTGFVRYIDNIVKRSGDFSRASAVSASDNAVAVKTIHKSKGLEYPFVFLCGTSVKFNMQDINSRMQINSDFGIGFKIQDRQKLRLYGSFPGNTVREINRSNAVSEEMRLLYVALTRAKEQLFITIPDNEKIRRRTENIRSETAALGIDPGSADSMLDWIIMAMLPHPDGGFFRDGAIIKQNDSKVRVNVCKAEADADESGSQSESSSAENVMPNENSVRMLKDMFGFEYSGELTQKPAKITVTEIAKSGDVNKIYLRRPEFAAEAGGLTAAEKGTAMHTFMQYADYAAAEHSVEDEASRLAENGMLSPGERDSLDIAQLKEFFGTELYARMKRSVRIRREQKFLIKKSDAALDDTRLMEYNGNSMLQGIADCMFEEEDGIVLIDYKTDKVQSESVLISRYDLQIKLYAAALEKIFGKRVKEAYLYSFSLGRAVKAMR